MNKDEEVQKALAELEQFEEANMLAIGAEQEKMTMPESSVVSDVTTADTSKWF